MIREKIICLGHIINSCPECKADEKNKQCLNYQPKIMRVFDVKENYDMKGGNK